MMICLCCILVPRYMTSEDMVIRNDPELAAIAKQYAADFELFVQDFAAAWTKVMNADRFRGPTGNECSPAAAAGGPAHGAAPQTASSSAAAPATSGSPHAAV